MRGAKMIRERFDFFGGWCFVFADVSQMSQLCLEEHLPSNSSIFLSSGTIDDFVCVPASVEHESIPPTPFKSV